MLGPDNQRSWIHNLMASCSDKLLKRIQSKQVDLLDRQAKGLNYRDLQSPIVIQDFVQKWRAIYQMTNTWDKAARLMK